MMGFILGFCGPDYAFISSVVSGWWFMMLLCAKSLKFSHVSLLVADLWMRVVGLRFLELRDIMPCRASTRYVRVLLVGK